MSIMLNLYCHVWVVTCSLWVSCCFFVFFARKKGKNAFGKQPETFGLGTLLSETKKTKIKPTVCLQELFLFFQ